MAESRCECYPRWNGSLGAYQGCSSNYDRSPFQTAGPAHDNHVAGCEIWCATQNMLLRAPDGTFSCAAPLSDPALFAMTSRCRSTDPGCPEGYSPACSIDPSSTGLWSCCNTNQCT